MKTVKYLCIFVGAGIVGLFWLYSPIMLIGGLVALAVIVFPLLWIPLWLGSEIFFGDFAVFGANPRTLLVLFFVPIFLVREIISFHGKNLRNVVSFLKIPAFIVVYGMVINMLNGSDLSEYLRWGITFSSNLLTVILLVLTVRDERSLKVALVVLFAVLAVNAMVGILQFAGVEQMYSLRGILHKQQFFATNARIIGLSRNSIQYSYELLLGSCLLMGFLFSGRKILFREHNKLWMSFFLVIVVTLFLNATRSALGGFFLALLFYLIILNRTNERRITPWLIFAVPLLFLVVLAYFLSTNATSLGVNPDKWLTLHDNSAIGRIPRLRLGYDIFSRHPFGIGTAGYEKYIFGSWSAAGTTHGMDLENFSIHNHFLRAFIELGYVGGCLFVLFLVTVWKRAQKLYAANQRDLCSYVSMGTLLFMMAYVVQMALHNFGPLSGDNIFWFLMGILLVAGNLRDKDCLSSL